MADDEDAPHGRVGLVDEVEHPGRTGAVDPAGVFDLGRGHADVVDRVPGLPGARGRRADDELRLELVREEPRADLGSVAPAASDETASCAEIRLLPGLVNGHG